MVCCQPALTATMNNMTVMVRSLLMISSVYVLTELDVPITFVPLVSCPYSNTRYITNLSNSIIFIVQVQLDRYSDEWDLNFT